MVQRRQITETEKRAVIDRQGLRCFIDNHLVDAVSDLEFDHIRPYATVRDSHPDNIAGVCGVQPRYAGKTQ